MRIRVIPLLAILLLAVSSASYAAPAFRLTSADFTDGGFLPAKCTADGADIPPKLYPAGVPAGAKSLALIVDDPDAPSGTFTHWLVWNIPPGAKTLGAHYLGDGPVEIMGANDAGGTGYFGPRPPSGTHRYFFHLFALDNAPQLAAGASRKELEAAMQGHIIATAVLMGRYSAHNAQ
jgi:Raf kinase inhibitor-like YbhB/YbcL family protein